MLDNSRAHANPNRNPIQDRRSGWIAWLIALFVALCCCVLPEACLAAPATPPPAPEGYDDHDYGKLWTFLEQSDLSGVKNGNKISTDYNPDYPNT